MLFLRDTREYINEAKLLYLLAAEILGERPTILPAQEPPTLTANVLLDRYQAILDGRLRDPFLDPLDLLVKVPDDDAIWRGLAIVESAPGAAVADHPTRSSTSGINLPTTTSRPGRIRHVQHPAAVLPARERCAGALLGDGGGPAVQDPPLHEPLGTGSTTGLVLAAHRSGAARARGRGGSRDPGGRGVAVRVAAALPVQRHAAEGARAVRRRPGPRRRAALGDAEPGRRGAVAPQEHPRTGAARVDQVGEAEGGRGGRRCAGRARKEQGVGRLQA